MESENQVLRQQALTISPNGNSLSARPRTTIIQVVTEYCNFYGICACKSVLTSECSLTYFQRTPQNGNVPNGETKILSVTRYHYFHHIQN